MIALVCIRRNYTVNSRGRTLSSCCVPLDNEAHVSASPFIRQHSRNEVEPRRKRLRVVISHHLFRLLLCSMPCGPCTGVNQHCRCGRASEGNQCMRLACHLSCLSTHVKSAVFRRAIRIAAARAMLPDQCMPRYEAIRI